MINFLNKISAQRYYSNTALSALSGEEAAAAKPTATARTAASVPLSKFESDRGRIINSAAVRRLQQKTQVFPLERNSAVRSRLTHSLEVQQVGRFIVQTIYKNLARENKLQLYTLAGLDRQVETLVEMACLMHDIGNPPFGHFGEQAINDWFRDNIEACNHSATGVLLPAPLLRDICHFEGNAQAIRLIHHLLNLNLTYTQIACVLKYTRCGTAEKPPTEHPRSYLYKKVGYYHSEAEFVQEICASLQMTVGQRHPFTYIMEAADDISYCIADLEDAVEKNILPLDRLIDLLHEEFKRVVANFGLDRSTLRKKHDLALLIRQAQQSAKRDLICATSQFFIQFRVKVIHPLVKHAAERFIQNIEAVYQGDFNAALLEDQGYCHAIAQTLKNVARMHVFNHKEIETMELRGYKIISGLLNEYAPLLKLTRAQFELTAAQDQRAPIVAKRLYNKQSNKHLRAYQRAVHGQDQQVEFYYRCRLLQDYISGMTDQFAFDEYRSLMAID